MAALRLYAISIDEVRDLIGATPAVAAAARADAAELFAAVPTPPGGPLSRLFARKRGAADRITTDPATAPTTADLQTVLSGHYPAPERARACWLVLEHLVACRAWGQLALDLDERGLAELDFELARAGVPADAGLAHVVDSDARIGLSPVPGLRVGHAHLAHVRRAAAALTDIDVTGPDAAAADALRHFLGEYAAWSAAAMAAGRLAPDLLAFHEV